MLDLSFPLGTSIDRKFGYKCNGRVGSRELGRLSSGRAPHPGIGSLVCIVPGSWTADFSSAAPFLCASLPFSSNACLCSQEFTGVRVKRGFYI